MSYYDWIRKNAKELKVSVKDLLCMTPSNDPFYVGRRSEIDMAQWAGEMYEKYVESRKDPSQNVLHVRRLHYYLVSLGNVMRPNGTPYENTQACWGYLVSAVKYARYLGTIRMDRIEDKKNEMVRNARYWKDESMDDHEISLEKVAETISADYLLLNQQNHQPYHVEIWIEKDTMNDVITPIARQYGIDVVVGEGEISLTQVFLLYAKIVGLIKKPIRIFYISDFDPKGVDMPISISRKIEWFTRRYEVEYNIKLKHLALTQAQCEEYELPRTPIKEGEGSGTGARAYDTLSAKFQSVYGQGATELDALEALYPRELRRIIVEAISPYWDNEVARAIRKFNEDLQESVYNSVMAQEEKLREALEDVDLSEAEEMFESFEVPEPEEREIDEEDWLFDSGRNYGDQLLRYKGRQAR